MSVLADIASGDVDAADVMFLLAAIAFALDVVLTLVGLADAARDATAETHRRAGGTLLARSVLVSIGLALVAVGLLLL
jgi:hypothetical protein